MVTEMRALDPNYIVGYLSQAGKSDGMNAEECKTLADGLDQFLSEMTYWLDSTNKRPKGEVNDT